jgi:hypothetical protein
MQAGKWRSTLRRWAVLFSVGLLAGCATSSGKPHASGTSRGPHAGSWTSRYRPTTNPSSQNLLAASDGAPVDGESSSQTVQGYTVPGRNPDSQAPWEFFLGNAAHRLIAYMYGVNHPQNQVYYNSWTMAGILRRTDFGDASRLLEEEQGIRPDITDVSIRCILEVKPWNERGLQEGREEVRIYLTALNRALLKGRSFTPGIGFKGEILIRFARGQYIWRLEWQTTEPGITQYRWTRSQQRFESERAAYDAGQWVDLTVEELRQYGGWVGQAVEDMVTRRERLATFSGAMGVVIDTVGESARVIFMGAILGRMSSGSGAQQPPAQGGGQVIPFPPRPPVTAPQVQVPAAARGM